MSSTPDFHTLIASLPPGGLPELVSRWLSHEQQQTLILAILREDEEVLEALSPRLLEQQPNVNPLMYAPAELAFNALTHLSTEFFNQHAGFLGKYLEDSLVQAERTEPAQKQLIKLKALIAQTKAGPDAAAIQEILKRLPYLKSADKLDLYLLMARIGLEGASYPDEETQKTALREWCLKYLDASNGAYLQIVHLYVWRQFRPKEALQALLFYEDKLEQEIGTNPDLKPYLLLYLRQAVYQFLHTQDPSSLWEFSKIHCAFQNAWMRALIEECLAHPAMKAIRENYQPDTEFSLPEHQAQLAQLEKRFDL